MTFTIFTIDEVSDYLCGVVCDRFPGRQLIEMRHFSADILVSCRVGLCGQPVNSRHNDVSDAPGYYCTVLCNFMPYLSLLNGDDGYSSLQALLQRSDQDAVARQYIMGKQGVERPEMWVAKVVLTLIYATTSASISIRLMMSVSHHILR